MKLRQLETQDIDIICNSLTNYTDKLDNELKELSTYRTELDNPVIIQAVALEQKRISMVKDNSSQLLNKMRDYAERINI